MPIADKKKVQTLVNVMGKQMQIMRGALVAMQSVKTKFDMANPNVIGTSLPGNVSALNGALSALQDAVNKNIWTQIIAANVPTHRNKALE